MRKTTILTKTLKCISACWLLLCIHTAVQAQTVTLKGTVISTTTHEPLEGAVIRTKYGAVLAIAGPDGKFACNIADSIVVFQVAHTAYVLQEVRIKKGAYDIIIGLTPAYNELEDVVVHTGYQSIPKERATGSFETISKTAYNRRVTPDVLSRIEGLSTGILFDRRTNANTATSNITIRGLSTINASKAPLVVLDNFPYEGDISNINPDDVESITMLKDAAAASIWGVQAGNGVIVITTKKGSYNQALRVNVTSTYSVTEKPNLFYTPQMNASDFINTERFLFDKGFYNADISNATTRPMLSPVVEILAKQRSGVLTVQQADAQIDALRSNDLRSDLMRYFYRNGASKAISLQMTAGSAASNHLLSIGYNKDIATLMGNDNTRLTLRNDNTMRLGKRLELRYGGQYVQTDREINTAASLVPGGTKAEYYPYAQLADASGNALPIVKDYRMGYTDTAGGGRLLGWKYAPLDELGFSDNTAQQRDFLLKTAIKYTVNSAVTIEAAYQYETGVMGTRVYQSPDSYYTRNLINRFTQLGATSAKYIVPNGGILDQSSSRLNAQALRTQVNYSKGWNEHRLTALAGGEIRENSIQANSYRLYGYDNDKLTFIAADFANSYPVYGGLSGNQVVPNNSALSDVVYRYTSLFANAAYTYKNRYIISTSARKDASNLFGVKSNQKGVPLWSAGVSWDASKEAFYKVRWLPQLRLRLTYGYSGNVDNNRSAYTTINFISNAPYTNLPWAGVVNPPNPSLRWEKVSMVNMAVDFATKNKLVSGSVEYYTKRATDLLAPVSIDPTSGMTRVTMNAAELRGRGVDVTLNTGARTKDFGWNSTVLFSYTQTLVHKYYNTSLTGAGFITSGYSVNPKEGAEAYALYSYRWGGLDPLNGDPLGYLKGAGSKDYQAIINTTTIDELVYHGSAVPKYYGALRNSMQYKGFTLAVNITYRFAYWFRNSSINYNRLYSQWSGHKDFANRWQQPGDEQWTQVPSMPYPANSRRDDFYLNSEVLVERADNIRLQDVTLSYTPAISMLNKVRMRNTEVYVTGSNLGLLWRANKHGADPDYGTGVPPGKVFSIGLRAGW